MTIFDDGVAANRAVIENAFNNANTQIDALTSEVASLTTQNNDLNTTVTSLNAQVASLQAQLAAEQTQVPPPSVETIYGAFPGPGVLNDTSTRAQMRARLDAALNIPVLPIERVYSETSFGLATQSPSPEVCVSYKQVPGLGTLGGPQAATVQAVTNELNSLKANPGVTYYVSLDHEVDNKIKSGTYDVATYQRALTQFVQILASVNAPNIKHAVCYMAWSFLQSNSNAWSPVNLWQPNTFDVIALDGYWNVSTTTKASDIFDPAMAFAKQTGATIHIWETSWTNSPPDETTALSWAEQIVEYLDDNVARVMWFESDKSDGNHLLEGHPGALAYYAARVQEK